MGVIIMLVLGVILLMINITIALIVLWVIGLCVVGNMFDIFGIIVYLAISFFVVSKLHR